MGKRAGFEALLRLGLPAIALALLVVAVLTPSTPALSSAFAAPPSPLLDGGASGVASCAGSTCHGREEPTGAVVRLDEIKIWQDESSPAGAHSRAWRVLGGARSRSIASRLGIGDPQSAPMCTGCHIGSPSARASEGVGCEACHGSAAGWLASHYAVGGTHAANVARGMRALDQPQVRAGVCLDCHYGSDKGGQFAEHRIMAAGHPRLSFELDLFSTLEKHWNVDGDYTARKRAPGSATLWAVGQAIALDRALTLFSNDRIANRGVFPELYFFDCQSCHRRIGDEPGYRPSAISNPGRGTPLGTPPFQDENMIMLAAAARVRSPDLAARFVADSLAFHKALTVSRPAAVAAATKLRADARAMADRLSGSGARETHAMIAALADTVTSARYTDYAGCVQAVMSIDTLLSSLADSGAVTRGDVQRIRPSIDRAYAAVRDPNAYNPQAFRTAMRTAATAIGALK